MNILNIEIKEPILEINKYNQPEDIRKVIVDYQEVTEKGKLALLEDAVTIKVDYYNVRKTAFILRAINHKLRQQLLDLIDREKRIKVTEIYIRLKLEQSVVSQHLAVLRNVGAVITERDGKSIYYIIDHKRVEKINTFVNKLIG
ncbi:MAG TPA: metalloregulator ArsR/SmtB family transcription factor [Ferruginibacter sp.]|nr:metalloregulator ArsR/SmtB family transcription factor [Ferruginibacter sp.]